MTSAARECKVMVSKILLIFLYIVCVKNGTELKAACFGVMENYCNELKNVNQLDISTLFKFDFSQKFADSDFKHFHIQAVYFGDHLDQRSRSN